MRKNTHEIEMRILKLMSLFCYSFALLLFHVFCLGRMIVCFVNKLYKLYPLNEKRKRMARFHDSLLNVFCFIFFLDHPLTARYCTTGIHSDVL